MESSALQVMPMALISDLVLIATLILSAYGGAISASRRAPLRTEAFFAVLALFGLYLTQYVLPTKEGFLGWSPVGWFSTALGLGTIYGAIVSRRLPVKIALPALFVSLLLGTGAGLALVNWVVKPLPTNAALAIIAATVALTGVFLLRRAERNENDKTGPFNR